MYNRKKKTTTSYRNNGKKIEQDFFATRLEKEKIILGHPWLTVHNLRINWTTGKVTLEQGTSPCSSPESTTP